jgi:hypothetical protein
MLSIGDSMTLLSISGTRYSRCQVYHQNLLPAISADKKQTAMQMRSGSPKSTLALAITPEHSPYSPEKT